MLPQWSTTRNCIRPTFILAGADLGGVLWVLKHPLQNFKGRKLLKAVAQA